jgi:hypothetical protein
MNRANTVIALCVLAFIRLVGPQLFVVTASGAPSLLMSLWEVPWPPTLAQKPVTASKPATTGM